MKLQSRHAEQVPLLGAVDVLWVRKILSPNRRNIARFLMVLAIYFGYFF